VATENRSSTIRLDHVTKAFGDVRAVDDLSLEIHEGEFLSLLGPSGCGKTTTLRMLGGFEEPTSGSIYFGDTEVTNVPPHRRDVNTVFQSYALFPHLSVADNIAFGLRRKGMKKAEAAARVSEMLTLVDLEGRGERKPTQLSGGQQQRVALARSLVNHPKLLLLDEPMSALDAKLRKTMQIELKRIQTQVGITFLYVTHDQEEAMTMSDRIVVMNHGRIEGSGSPREVYEHPATEFVATFLGASNLLAGTLEAPTGEFDVTRHAYGSFRSPRHRTPAGLTGSVKVGVRPEKMALQPAGSPVAASDNSLAGQVIVSTFTGVGNQYLVAAPHGEEFVVYAQNSGQAFAPRSGEDVVMTWPVEHTFVVQPSKAAPSEGDSDD
jgi:spermidine/putrescine transport system ATP-binding protein